MKLLLSSAVLLATSCLAQAQNTVTYVPKEQVAAALAKGGQLVKASGYLVSASHRDKAGQAEIHDHETDVFYVVDGAATFVTGGEITGGKRTKPGQHLGTGISGGQTHQLQKGDVIVIPAGTPHWFKEVPKSVSYYVVKVVK